MLHYVSVEQIMNHPNNPRIALGDLTELADSIKTNGVLQNLTIVPASSVPDSQQEEGQLDGMYYAVIGNRRLAAAKLAGEDIVPCIISDMDFQQQVRTMLMENLQRHDLTAIEQAHGFQMMLDLGETATSISEKTGFSASTVRQRLKLLELDREKLEEASNRGATLMDFAELEKVKDVERRNNVLSAIGTNNFRNELRKAIDAEREAKLIANIQKQLDTFAKPVGSNAPLRFVRSYYITSTEEVTRPDDADTVEYLYRENGWGFTLYRKATDEDLAASTAAAEREAKEQARKRQLEDTAKRMYELRKAHAVSVSNATAKKNFSSVAKYAAKAILDRNYITKGELCKSLNIQPEENKGLDEGEITKCVGAEPYRGLFLIAYFALETCSLQKYHGCNGKHTTNAELDNVYDLLSSVSYCMSDEEKSMQNGTHALFTETAAEEPAQAEADAEAEVGVEAETEVEADAETEVGAEVGVEAEIEAEAA